MTTISAEHYTKDFVALRFADDLAMIDPGYLVRAVQPERIAATIAFAEKFATQIHAAEPEYLRRVRESLAPKVEMQDGIGIISIEGPLAFAPDPFEMMFLGLEDSRMVERAIKSAAIDPSVRGIMLRINSPGGQVMGGQEMADAVTMASERKPVMAHASGMMASLAYVVGSQARAGVYASPSAESGSIGVIMTAVDRSRMLENAGIKVELITNKAAKFKGTANPNVPLTEEGRQYLKDRAEAAFGRMRATILAARPGVPDESMQAQLFTGKDAIAAGLVDAVGSFDFAMAALRNRMNQR